MQGKGIDASINENGRKQAEAFYDHYKNEGFDVIYTSTLKRTTESVQAFIDDGLPQIKLAGLDEISWGVYEGVEAGYEDKLFFKEVTERWANGETSLAIDEGESPYEVAQRQQEVIKLIKEAEEENVLICMHGRALRIFLTQLLAIPLKKMDQFEHTNLCLYQLNYTNGKFVLVKENDIRHLSTLNKNQND